MLRDYKYDFVKVASHTTIVRKLSSDGKITVLAVVTRMKASVYLFERENFKVMEFI